MATCVCTCQGCIGGNHCASCAVTREREAQERPTRPADPYKKPGDKFR